MPSFSLRILVGKHGNLFLQVEFCPKKDTKVHVILHAHVLRLHWTFFNHSLSFTYLLKFRVIVYITFKYLLRYVIQIKSNQKDVDWIPNDLTSNDLELDYQFERYNEKNLIRYKIKKDKRVSIIYLLSNWKSKLQMQKQLHYRYILQIGKSNQRDLIPNDNFGGILKQKYVDITWQKTERVSQLSISVGFVDVDIQRYNG